MPQDIVHPINTVIAEDDGLVIEEFEVGATAVPAEMIPGTWVKYDTVEGNVQAADDESSGIIGLLMEKADGSLTDVYQIGERCRVVTGGKGKVMVRRIVNGGAVAPGVPMVSAALGLTKIQAVGAQGAQGEIVCIASEIIADDTVAESYVVAKIHKGVLDLGT